MHAPRIKSTMGSGARQADTLSDWTGQYLGGVGGTVKFRPSFGRAIVGAINDGRIGASVEQQT